VIHGELILSGFSIVMGVLAMLWGVTALIATIFNRPAKPEPVAQAAAPAPAASSVPDHHLAAIAAAVATSFAVPHRIVSVSGPHTHVSAWTQQGLFEHFSSHRMEWRANPSGRVIRKNR
jgi:glutaconyl-CoA/methylmalonyl-CoA decarboxylase subunit delta